VRVRRRRSSGSHRSRMWSHSMRKYRAP
jgi:hypothetical protein